MTKRQQSSIDRLPADIRDQLHALLRDPRVTQLDATARINEILDAEGHAERLSKSAVNRYAVRMEEIGAKIRQAREISRMWIGQLGAEPAGEVGKLLNEMVRTLAFDVMSEASADGAKVEPKMLKDLAIAVHRLEMAARENAKVEAEIRKKALQEVAKVVAEEEQAAGPMSADRFREIIREQYGV